ncbi:MAG TPA: PadR family transcriptional regulator [Herpetosiphonaceae bacterium]|nr:PadR family transcriptional regulator [Herpetosiphonaceae bacterium]
MSPMVKTPLTMEHALLGLLVQRPMHAYEMHQILQETRALGLVWHLKQSQLYALLARLEDAGYLTGNTEPQGTRPPRKILHVTPDGRAAFSRWLGTPVAHGRDFRQEFLAKLFFAQAEDPDTVAALLDRQRRECRRWLAELYEKLAERGREHPFDTLVLQFRISQIDAILCWLDTCAATLAPQAASR